MQTETTGISAQAQAEYDASARRYRQKTDDQIIEFGNTGRITATMLPATDLMVECAEFLGNPHYDWSQCDTTCASVDHIEQDATCAYALRVVSDAFCEYTLHTQIEGETLAALVKLCQFFVFNSQLTSWANDITELAKSFARLEFSQEKFDTAELNFGHGILKPND